jgi:hypothetical protein
LISTLDQIVHGFYLALRTGIAVDIDQIVASFFGERIQIIIGIGISPVRLFSRLDHSHPDETVIIPRCRTPDQLLRFVGSFSPTSDQPQTKHQHTSHGNYSFFHVTTPGSLFIFIYLYLSLFLPLSSLFRIMPLTFYSTIFLYRVQAITGGSQNNFTLFLYF